MHGSGRLSVCTAAAACLQRDQRCTERRSPLHEMSVLCPPYVADCIAAVRANELPCPSRSHVNKELEYYYYYYYYRFIDIWQPKAGLQYTYIHTVNNHTIKYESMSLVVGEAIAYKRVFKPISPCKNNWEFVCRSKTISD